MLSLQSLTKRYNRGTIKAVDNLTLRVNRGEIFGFLGPNGAGKTTTIKMIVGLLRPDGGRVIVNGIDAWRDPLAAKRRIGYVPDNPDLWEKVTGQEYLGFIADVFRIPISDRSQRTKDLLEVFELQGAIRNPIQSYSHGMRQKLALIASLLHHPPLWLLDEPMVGLDPRSSFIVKELMRSHCDQGGAVFFSTHILEVAERICDRVGIIHQGHLVAEGTVEEIHRVFSGPDQQSLEDIFLAITEAKLSQEQLESLAR